MATPLTFDPRTAPPMFLAVSPELVRHFTGRYSFRDSRWGYMEYDPDYLRTGVPGGDVREFTPGAIEESLELHVQASPLLSGKYCCGRPAHVFSYCLAQDARGGWWAFATDDSGALRLTTLWDLTVDLIALSDGAGSLMPKSP